MFDSRKDREHRLAVPLLAVVQRQRGPASCFLRRLANHHEDSSLRALVLISAAAFLCHTLLANGHQLCSQQCVYLLPLPTGRHDSAGFGSATQVRGSGKAVGSTRRESQPEEAPNASELHGTLAPSCRLCRGPLLTRILYLNRCLPLPVRQPACSQAQAQWLRSSITRINCRHQHSSQSTFRVAVPRANSSFASRRQRHSWGSLDRCKCALTDALGCFQSTSLSDAKAEPSAEANTADPVVTTLEDNLPFPEEVVVKVEKLKNEGNTAFRQDKFSLAKEMYSQVCSGAGGHGQPMSSTVLFIFPINKSQSAWLKAGHVGLSSFQAIDACPRASAARELLGVLFSNRSFTNEHLKDAEGAKRDAQAVRPGRELRK